MGGGVSTDFKSSNRIELSPIVQLLLNFYQFEGYLHGGRPPNPFTTLSNRS